MYVLSLYEAGSAASQQEAQQWVAHTAARVQALAACGSSSGSGRLAAPRQAAEQQPPGGKVQQGIELPEPFRLREGKQRYLQNIGSCMQVRWVAARCCEIGEYTCACKYCSATIIWRSSLHCLMYDYNCTACCTAGAVRRRILRGLPHHHAEPAGGARCSTAVPHPARH